MDNLKNDNKKKEREAIKQALIAIIEEGMKLLEKKLNYQPATIVRKLKVLDVSITPSSMTKLLNYRKGGIQLVNNCLEGIKEIIYSELGYEWSEDSNDFIENTDPAWTQNIIPENKIEEKEGFKFYDKGRLQLSEKASFIKNAKHEIVELGVRLNSFTHYFLSNKEEDYKKYIIELLEKGVNFKLYLLNPDSNIARLYFEDRAKIEGFEEEADSTEEIKKIINRLKKLSEQFKKANYKGKFQVFKYKNFPYNHLLIVDGIRPQAKLLTSHYLYGTRRSQCPVIYLEKSYYPELFDIYWNSYQEIRKTAEPI